jgi:dTDP-4-amino-4,6-dideoxygalactose transaminase
LFVIRTSKRDELQKYMNDNGIQTLIHYPIPPHKQQAYREFNKLSFPITEKVHEELLSLPLRWSNENDEIKQIVNALNNINARKSIFVSINYESISVWGVQVLILL